MSNQLNHGVGWPADQAIQLHKTNILQVVVSVRDMRLTVNKMICLRVVLGMGILP